jgi:uncharacterized membrane protein
VTDRWPMQHASLWLNGSMTDFGVLPGGEDSGADAISSQGVIVGSSGRIDPVTNETSYRPVIYANGTMTAIPAPSSDAYARDINDAGVVRPDNGAEFQSRSFRTLRVQRPQS